MALSNGDEKESQALWRKGLTKGPSEMLAAPASLWALNKHGAKLVSLFTGIRMGTFIEIANIAKRGSPSPSNAQSKQPKPSQGAGSEYVLHKPTVESSLSSINLKQQFTWENKTEMNRLQISKAC